MHFLPSILARAADPCASEHPSFPQREQSSVPHFVNENEFAETQPHLSFRDGIAQPRTSTFPSDGEQTLSALTSGMDYDFNHDEEDDQNIQDAGPYPDNTALGASFSTNTVSENSVRNGDEDEGK